VRQGEAAVDPGGARDPEAAARRSVDKVRVELEPPDALGQTLRDQPQVVPRMNLEPNDCWRAGRNAIERQGEKKKKKKKKNPCQSVSQNKKYKKST
jgi:hypothetical protein